jgi:hypothetical protein
MPSASHVPAPGATELYDLIWFPQQEWWGDLAAIALPENWDDDASGRLSILFAYVKYYTRRIVEEGLWAEGTSSSGAKLAAFDTGLLSRHFEPIYAVFEQNRNRGRQPWVHKEWASPSSSRLKAFDLANDVRRALFFTDPVDVVYDPRLPVVPNLDHILDDNVDRYPQPLQENSYLRKAALENAIHVAAARARANWRLAAPQFYWPPDAPGRVQLLLPLSLINPETVDLALVLDRAPPYADQPDPGLACYRAHTVLPLEWAYRNARLITRPEAYWLDINTRDAVDRAPVAAHRSGGEQ